jgi:hypothetical protein
MSRSAFSAAATMCGAVAAPGSPAAKLMTFTPAARNTLPRSMIEKIGSGLAVIGLA